MALWGQRSKPIRFSIPEPCQEDWDGMDGASGQRYCQKCRHQVHDLSLLTRTEAARLIESSRGQRLCGRVTLDATGEVIYRPDAKSGELCRIAGFSLVSIVAGAATPAVSMAQDQPSCPLRVQVADTQGASIPGATISQRSGHVGKTNTFGLWSGSTSPGTSEVRVNSPGFVERILEVACKSGERIELTVELPVAASSIGGVIVESPTKAATLPGPVRRTGLRRGFWTFFRNPPEGNH